MDEAAAPGGGGWRRAGTTQSDQQLAVGEAERDRTGKPAPNLKQAAREPPNQPGTAEAERPGGGSPPNLARPRPGRRTLCRPEPEKTDQGARGALRVSPPPPPARGREWRRRHSDCGAERTAATVLPSLPEREARGGRPARRAAPALRPPGEVPGAPGRPAGANTQEGARAREQKRGGREGGRAGAPACAHNEAAETHTFARGSIRRAAPRRAPTESAHQQLSNRGAAAQGCSRPGRAYLRSPGRECPPG